MRVLFIPFILLTLLGSGGCAILEPSPEALTPAQLVLLAREGKTGPELVEELKRTHTVIVLSASDFVALSEAGVPREALDYLQQALIEDIRWRERYWGGYWPGYSPFYRGFGPCPFPPLRHYRGGFWGC